jgi:ribonucleoside-diphosphate reductase alpha chain
MISAVYRRGGDVAFVAGELKAISDKKGGAWLGGKHLPSLIAAIGDIIEKHMLAIGFIQPREEPAVPLKNQVLAHVPGRQCPKCGEAALIRIENCDQCLGCGYSKCS